MARFATNLFLMKMADSTMLLLTLIWWNGMPTSANRAATPCSAICPASGSPRSVEAEASHFSRVAGVLWTLTVYAAESGQEKLQARVAIVI